MKFAFIPLIPVFLICVSFGSAELLSERTPEREQAIPPRGIRSFVETFKAQKEARAIVSGSGKSCMGLYVFDEHGNCVAKDDITSPRTCDDAAVVWVPTATGRYDVEVCNAGLDSNVFSIGLK